MLTTWLRVAVIAIISWAAIVVGGAGSTPLTLAEAEAIAARQHEQYFEYHARQFMAYYGPRYARFTNECLAKLHSPDRAPLSFVAVLDRQGRVVKTYRNKETNVFVCINSQLMQDTFPAPPVAPYFAHFKMDFPSR